MKELEPCKVKLTFVCWPSLPERRDKLAKVVGPVVAKARKSQRLTADQLADAIGASRGSVSTWENGHSLPEAVFIRALAERLGVTADTLLGVTAAETARHSKALSPQEIRANFVSIQAQLDSLTAIVEGRAPKSSKRGPKGHRSA